MITLYQFPRVWGLPNASPFCLKLETYLRLADIPYEIKFLSDPRKAPKGKLPFIKIDDKTIADSEIIIDFLQGKLGDQLDRNLTQEQRSFSVLLDNSFTERLYWMIVYMRWQYEPNWPHVKDAFFGKLPMILQWFLPDIVRKKTIKALWAQGMGRHSYDEVLEMGYKFLDALAIILAEKSYFHGEKPSSIDATAFAFLANIAWTPYDEALKSHLNKHKNLLVYCDKIWSTFYPELEKPFSLIT